MTRPTEKQLAAEIAACIDRYAMKAEVFDREAVVVLAADVDLVLSAYRSAQQAEAGAAGGVREQFEATAKRLMGYSNHRRCHGGNYEAPIVEKAWQLWSTAVALGRQQGMEQAMAESNAAMVSVLPGPYYMDPPDGGDVSLIEQLRRMAEDAGLWRKHEAAASSAQEPLPQCRVADVGFRWDPEQKHHVPNLLIEFEPVPMNEPANSKGWADRAALAAILAAPTRLAGAAQGEAVAWARMCTIDDDDGRAIGIDEPEVSWGAECPDPSEDWSPLYAHPQAQVGRKPLDEGPKCRDCADFGPICPSSGQPCGGTPSTASDDGSV